MSFTQVHGWGRAEADAVIPYGRQEIDESDIAAVVEVLRSDFLTQGPVVPRFEEKVAYVAGAAHGVAVNSATSALHLACLALDVSPGDRVWTSPITFVASANCAAMCGAEVDFVDIDPHTANISTDALERKLAAAEQRGRLPKVVIPVHFGGEPCDMAAIGALARRYGFAVIEDASHAIGAAYGGQPIGACEHSEIAVFSFHPVKIVTAGEGGMALTQSPELAARMRLLRNHGVTRDPSEMTTLPDGAWYYQQVALGFNYRMTDIQAALGASQLERLPQFLMRRHDIARRYDSALTGLPVRGLERDPRNFAALHLYVVCIDPTRTNRSRADVFAAMRDAGIGVNVHYIPVHTQPFYRARGFAPGDYPQAEEYYRQAITLPIYFGLREIDQDRVIAALKDALT